MVSNHKLVDAGFFTVRHLFDSNGNFKGLSCPRLLHRWPVDHFLLASLVDAIPEKWRKQLKANGAMTSLNEHCIDCSVSLCLKGRKIYTDKVQSKLLYEKLSSQIQGSQIRQVWHFLRQNCSNDSTGVTEGVTSTPEIFGNKHSFVLTFFATNTIYINCKRCKP